MSVLSFLSFFFIQVYLSALPAYCKSFGFATCEKQFNVSSNSLRENMKTSEYEADTLETPIQESIDIYISFNLIKYRPICFVFFKSTILYLFELFDIAASNGS